MGPVITKSVNIPHFLDGHLKLIDLQCICANHKVGINSFLLHEVGTCGSPLVSGRVWIHSQVYLSHIAFTLNFLFSIIELDSGFLFTLPVVWASSFISFCFFAFSIYTLGMLFTAFC